MSTSPENIKAWREILKDKKVKPARYKSIHDPNLKPSYSTFTKNTPTQISSNDKPRNKPLLPSKSELGRLRKMINCPRKKKENKNFVHDNAVTVIKGSAKKAMEVRRRVENQMSKEKFIAKQDYGKSPEYLQGMKECIQKEKDIVKELLNKQSEQERLDHEKKNGVFLKEEDRLELLKELKRKWASVNKHFQSILSAQTLVKLREKERLEKTLKQIELDIKTVSKPSILLC